jgi:hypothetical protein
MMMMAASLKLIRSLLLSQMYTVYCANQPNSDSTHTKCKAKNPAYAAFLDVRHQPPTGPNPSPAHTIVRAHMF